MTEGKAVIEDKADRVRVEFEVCHPGNVKGYMNLTPTRMEVDGRVFGYRRGGLNSPGTLLLEVPETGLKKLEGVPPDTLKKVEEILKSGSRYSGEAKRAFGQAFGHIECYN